MLEFLIITLILAPNIPWILHARGKKVNHLLVTFSIVVGSGLMFCVLIWAFYGLNYSWVGGAAGVITPLIVGFRR